VISFKKLKWAVGIFILGYLIFSFDIRNITAVISSANPALLVTALIIYAATFVILSMRWKKILSRMGVVLPLREAYPAFVGGTLLSDFTPARLGDLGRAYLVRKRLEPKLGVVSVIVDRYMDILAILLLSAIGLLILRSEKGISGEDLVYITLSLSVILFAFLLGALLLWFKRKRTHQFVQGFAGKFMKIEKLASHLSKFDEGLGKLKNPRTLLPICVIYTLAAWLTHALRVSLIIQAVDATMPFYYLPFLLPMISALALLPISPGGLGLVEGGMVAILDVFGVPPSTGIAIALIDRTLTVFFHSIVGPRVMLFGENKG